jgi:hypothetical protein
MSNLQEIWQVEVNGQVYEANLEELSQWIAEGALLPQDKVRRGNLRWLEAGKIPSLYGFFNAKELGMAPPVVTTVVDASPTIINAQTKIENYAATQTFVQSENNTQFNQPVSATAASASQTEFQNFAASLAEIDAPPSNACAFHPAEEPKYVCETCANHFCKACPKSYGGSVKICPMCGAMCKPIVEFQAKQQKAFQYSQDVTKGFGFSDFGRALAYPFKFRFSLISGAIIYAFFSLGQGASGIGGMYMVAAAIFCAMMANALTFGCLANTVENMSQGKLSENFMPSFDDFNLWDDVVHPFFLSLAAYLISFGLLIALVLGMVWYTWHSVSSQQSSNLSQISQQAKQAGDQGRITPNGERLMSEEDLTPEQRQALQAGDLQKMQELMQQQRKAELESVAGKSPETRQKEMQQTVQNLLKVGIPFIFGGFLAALWGLSYFPAACAVAGYTRSFWSTLNPLVGLDTIKRMGFDYVKILMMCFTLAVFAIIISGTLTIIFSPFDLPGMGNIPAKVIGSLFTFYFSIVFAVTLGFALYKNSAKLNLYHG